MVYYCHSDSPPLCWRSSRRSMIYYCHVNSLVYIIVYHCRCCRWCIIAVVGDMIHSESRWYITATARWYFIIVSVGNILSQSVEDILLQQSLIYYCCRLPVICYYSVSQWIMFHQKLFFWQYIIAADDDDVRDNTVQWYYHEHTLLTQPWFRENISSTIYYCGNGSQWYIIVEIDRWYIIVVTAVSDILSLKSTDDILLW